MMMTSRHIAGSGRDILPPIVPKVAVAVLAIGGTVIGAIDCNRAHRKEVLQRTGQNEAVATYGDAWTQIQPIWEKVQVGCNTGIGDVCAEVWGFKKAIMEAGFGEPRVCCNKVHDNEPHPYYEATIDISPATDRCKTLPDRARCDWSVYHAGPDGFQSIY
ncbi:MAG: hypothetical protein UV80_C0001G0029 [Candidatus Peregrinibacteria bacterium GW2011_GWF2_43_17]|nr:MAG: hypothetical protein UV80_C0001G0029 [Candidatus Peregrinibacteria bacterium GW2011_GWF2_43_17]HAU40272.1 hypothetical protein [Candidatus Peregrinibacteria bacterium]